MRCLRLANDLMRSYRASSGKPVTLPTYERLPNFVLCYSAPAIRSRIIVEGKRVDRTRTAGPWAGPVAVLLEHGNMLDPVPGEDLDDETGFAFASYMWSLRNGDPRFIYRERYTEAVRALRVDGEYGQAVVLAVTASEVLVDWLLALLLWEKHEDAELSATLFQEGKVLRRLTVDLPELLRGNWSTSTTGPVNTWYQQAYILRHRVVHGGRTPSRPAAQAALRATLGLERHAMDRLVDRRSVFPRATLMSVAQAGLRRRDRWSGKIKRFAENEASQSRTGESRSCPGTPL